MNKILKKLVVLIITLEARLALWLRRPKILVITGSVGKTSTKDAVLRVVASKFRARGSVKSQNTEIGVPLSILGLENAWFNPLLWVWNFIVGFWKVFSPSFPAWLVLEVGADRPNDLRKIFSWLVPDVVVATVFPKIPVHVAYYDSPERVWEEEALPAKMLGADGVLVANGDDWREEVLGGLSQRTVFYGFSPKHDVSGSKVRVMYKDNIPLGMEFEVTHLQKNAPGSISGSLGIQAVYPVLSAVTVGTVLGIGLSESLSALGGHTSPPGRMRVIEGLKDSILIDDSYNSSPRACEEALLVLKKIKEETGRRAVAILGDMRELGSFSDEEHRRIGRLVGSFANVLMTVGVESRNIADGALDAQMDENRIYQFDASTEAGNFLESILQTGDAVLVKGSEGVRMERVTKEVMAEPSRAPDLLVRQENNWLTRK